MKVIPNGVNTRVFKPGAGSEERRAKELDAFDTVIGYVGALSRVRKVGDLLSAFADLEESERVALVLLGDGPDEDSLRSEASTLGLGNRVRFAGSVPYSEVPAWMRCFDVAVDPTAVRMRTSKGVHTASYSQKIGQYLASGLPVLAWRCRDTEFLDEEGVGMTAPYPDAHALASALQNLTRMVRTRKDEIRRRAREAAERRFDSQALADRRVAWWRKIVDDHREGVK
jgi:phosphatidylinositol alpha-1,6-mannosyltransferase